jgi:hypothetical protein
MNRNLQTLAVPAAIAAGFLFGCSSPPRITDRTDSNRPAIELTQEGYDTFGRKWEDEPIQPVTHVTPPQETPAAQSQMLTRDDSVVLNFTGTITDIDYANREMSLQGPEGRIETFAVDKSVRRFNEAKVGDKVSIDYYLGMNAEVRKPTPEEERNPLVVMEGEGRAGPESAPAAQGLRRIRAVVTIEAMDRQNQTLTVKGPRGKYYVARVKDPSRFDQVQIGDTIVMTFTEAAAISLKPAEN